MKDLRRRRLKAEFEKNISKYNSILSHSIKYDYFNNVLRLSRVIPRHIHVPTRVNTSKLLRIELDCAKEEFEPKVKFR